MNYQCQNPACENRESIGERSAKRHDHKCEDCGSALVPLVEACEKSSSLRESADLRHLVETLPTMLALPLDEYLAETRSILKLWGICEFAELSLRLIVTMGIADHRGQLPPALIAALAERIERPTLGKWLGMAQALASHVPASTLFPELEKTVNTLAVFLGDKRDAAQTAALPLRNLLAHGGVRKQQAEALIELWAPRMFEIAGAVAWLKTIDILGRNPDGNLTLMKGREPALAQRHDVAPEPAEALWLRRGNTLLGLWPLGRFAAAGSDEDPASARSPQLYIRRGEVRLQYSNFGGDHPVSESGETALESFLDLFRTAACPAQEGDFSVRGFEAETRKEAERLIGRIEELAQLRSAVNAMQGGLLWLGGPAGMGKSCLVAALAGELLDSAPKRALILIYRFRATDDRCSRDSFCRFAIERLERWDGLQPAEKDLSKTATAMERLKHCIARISDDHSVMFILDGLDEIAERDPYFHKQIPIALANKRAGFVCVGRPERNLPDDFRQAGAKEPFSDGLPPMRPADVRAMLMDLTDAPLRRRLAGRDKDAPDRVSNPFIDRICELAAGLPLYVRYAAGDIIAGKLAPEAEGQLPAGLHKYHEELLRRCAVGDLQAVLTPIVVLLALAYEPLSVEQLAAFLVRRGVLQEPDVCLINRALNGIASMVRRTLTSDGQEGYTVFHHSLSQHILQGPHLAQTVAVTRTALADAAKLPAGDAAVNYLYRCGIRHLVDAGQAADALSLLMDFSHVMHRLQTLGSGKLVVAGYYLDWEAFRATSPLAGDAAIWWDFLRSNRHLLMRACADWGAHKILLQLAIEHADNSPLTQAAEAWLSSGKCDWPWLRQINRPVQYGTNCLVVFQGHDAPVAGAQELPESRILTWSYDGSLRIWDARTGDTLARLQAHAGAVLGALLLHNGRLLSWSADATLRLWDTKQGFCLCRMSGHSASINGALLLPDGRILSWSQDCSLRVWNSDTGACVAVLEGHTGSVHRASLGAGLIVSWSSDKTVRLWDSASYAGFAAIPTDAIPITLRSGKSLLVGASRIQELNGAIALPAKELDEMIGWEGWIELASGNLLSWDFEDIEGFANLYVWDPWTARRTALLEGHSHSIWGACELPDARILSWSADHTLRIWDPQTGKVLHVLEGHTGEVRGALLVDEATIVSWSEDGSLRIWESTKGKPLGVLEGHYGEIIGACLVGRKHVLSWSANGEVRLWNPLIPSLSTACDDQHGEIIGSARILHDQRIITWSKDGSLRTWDGDTGKDLQILRPDDHTDWIKWAWVLDNQRLLSWEFAGRLRLWNMAAGKLMATMYASVELSDVHVLDGDRVLAVGFDGYLRTYDTTSGKQITVVQAAIFEAGLGNLHSAVLKDGRILSWGDDGSFRVWTAACDRPLAEMHLEVGVVQGAVVHEDGQRMLTWLSQDGMCLWDLPSGRLLWHFSQDKKDPRFGFSTICGAQFLAGDRLLSSANDGSIQLWDTTTRSRISQVEGLGEGRRYVRLLKDGSIASWSEEGTTLAIWDMERNTCRSVYKGSVRRDEPDIWRQITNWDSSGWRWTSEHDLTDSPLPGLFWLHSPCPEFHALSKKGVLVFAGGRRVLLVRTYHGQRRIDFDELGKLMLT